MPDLRLHPRQDQGHLAVGTGHESKERYAQPGPEIQEGNLTTTYSEVNITQGQWVSEKTYTCRVNYYGSNSDNHARRCTGIVLTFNTQTPGAQGGGWSTSHGALPHSRTGLRGVSTYLIPPSSCTVNKSPKITCLAVDLASTTTEP